MASGGVQIVIGDERAPDGLQGDVRVLLSQSPDGTESVNVVSNLRCRLCMYNMRACTSVARLQTGLHVTFTGGYWRLSSKSKLETHVATWVTNGPVTGAKGPGVECEDSLLG